MVPQPHPVCKGDYNHKGAHTQLPEGSGRELAKGVTWGVVEDRKGGEGKSPISPEEKESGVQAPGAGEDRSQTFSKTTPQPPAAFPTFQVSWQLLTFSNPALPQVINYCSHCRLHLSSPHPLSKSTVLSDDLNLLPQR